MKFLRVEELAARVGVTERCIRKWITLGRLPGCRRHAQGHHLIPEIYTNKVLAGELPLKPRRRKEVLTLITP